MSVFDFNKFYESALQLIYPRVCPVCEEILTDKNRSEENSFICRECYDELSFVKEPYCMKCGKPIEDENEAFCRNCKDKHRYFDRGMSLLMHDDKAKKILYDLKYSNRQDNADFAGYEAAKRLGKIIMGWEPDVIVPVPLHKKRQMERGFNQAALLSEKISEYLKILYGISIKTDPTYLLRKEKTRPQKELNPFEREKNVSGKFTIRDFSMYREGIKENNSAPAHYKRVLLLDDIFTSGATLNECARILKETGTEEVFFITMSIV